MNINFNPKTTLLGWFLAIADIGRNLHHLVNNIKEMWEFGVKMRVINDNNKQFHL